MGHVGRAPGTYEWVVPGLPYILVYTINANDDEVTIVGVFHGARSMSKPGI
jgi:plasmid stabilization system protein ParE